MYTATDGSPGTPPTETGREIRWILCIFGLAVAIRVLVGVVTTSWVFPSTDHFWQYGYEMGQIAASLSSGDGFSWPSWSAYPQGPTAWMAPIQPFLMGAAFKAFGAYSVRAAVAIELFQVVVSALSCVLLYFIGRRVFNAPTGLIAATLFALYPPSIHFAVQKLWSTSLLAACLLLLTLMLLGLAARPDLRRGMRVGAVLGFTALVEPVVVAALPFVLVWLYWHAAGPSRMILKTATGLMVAFCLVISPWLLRNYSVFGEFVFIKSNFGHELFLGNNEYGGGGANQRGSSIRSAFAESGQDPWTRPEEPAFNRFLLHEAIDFMADNPLQTARSILTRVARYWTVMGPVNTWQEQLSLVTYLAILGLAGAGLFLTDLRNSGVQLLVVFLVSIPIPNYLTIVHHYRYRLPIEPFLVLLAAYALYKLLERVWNRPHDRPPAPVRRRIHL
ncbi:MAG TPA: glycosyltransferase family 39 protein [Gemmatimonadota bacterium]|nr:glycosyltransferase family 39 protein [Gemmatimonadota bacterium]